MKRTRGYYLQLLAGAFRLDVYNSVLYSNGLVFWIEAVDCETVRRQVDGPQGTRSRDQTDDFDWLETYGVDCRLRDDHVTRRRAVIGATYDVGVF